MRQVVASAPTREEAIKKALSELGVEMYEVDDIKILDEGSRGLFGLGARPVKVQVSTKDLERPARGNDRPQRDRSVEPQTRREENRGANREEGRGRDRGARNDRPEKPARTDKPVQQEKPAAERKPERGERQGNAPREAAAKQEQPREQRPPRERGERGGRDRNDRGGNRERSEERPAQQAANKPREERKRDERPPRREPQPPREPREPRADRASHNEDKAAFAQISDEHGHQAASLLAEIISAMGIQAEVAFKREPESAARLEVKSEDGALLIGRKGATLGALQYLINRMISQSEDGESLERVVVDVEGYLDRRRESLEDLARSMAAKARETGRSMRLKPMSPQERRIIHVTLQEDPDVRTYSQGEALYRSVVISPSAEVAVAIRSAGGGTGGERRDGGRGNQNANNESTSGTTPNAGSGRPLRNGRRIRPRGGRRNETDVDAGAFGD